MKKLTAFLLTLTLLLGMVGTVSLAADDVKGTTFPKESVTRTESILPLPLLQPTNSVMHSSAAQARPLK